ncbi:hypothetical protein Tsubulata_039882 [Turnera subulata]|uniref:DUF4283 domain-containing protein n=1 Tax=Turnera subulata TaxID=218843 RepID=A0A9Q0JJ15_9ROSI|nr:hypothetical protein Tsubulata_039882 [Turnera subulata]
MLPSAWDPSLRTRVSLTALLPSRSSLARLRGFALLVMRCSSRLTRRWIRVMRSIRVMWRWRLPVVHPLAFQVTTGATLVLNFLSVVTGRSDEGIWEFEDEVECEDGDIVFVDGKFGPAMELSDAFKCRLNKPWQKAIIVKLIGCTIGYKALCSRLQTLWKPKGAYRVIDLANNFMSFGLRGRMIRCMPLLMVPGRFLVVPCLSSCGRRSFERRRVSWLEQLFVQLPDLDPSRFHPCILSGLGRLIGRPIRTDIKTINVERGQYARVAVDIDLLQPLKGKVELDGTPLRVSYEGLPQVCYVCGCVSHPSIACPRRSPSASPNSGASPSHAQSGKRRDFGLPASIDSVQPSQGSRFQALLEETEGPTVTVLPQPLAKIPPSPSLKGKELASGTGLGTGHQRASSKVGSLRIGSVVKQTGPSSSLGPLQPSSGIICVSSSSSSLPQSTPSVSTGSLGDRSKKDRHTAISLPPSSHSSIVLVMPSSASVPPSSLVAGVDTGLSTPLESVDDPHDRPPDLNVTLKDLRTKVKKGGNSAPPSGVSLRKKVVGKPGGLSRVTGSEDVHVETDSGVGEGPV